MLKMMKRKDDVEGKFDRQTAWFNRLGFSMPQLFQVLQKLSVCFQSQRLFFLKIKI